MTRAEVQAATLRRLTDMGVTRWTGVLADEAEGRRECPFCTPECAANCPCWDEGAS